MDLTLTERTASVLAEIRAGLELAEKATEGPWTQTADIVWLEPSGRPICRADYHKTENALFIARYCELGPKGLEALAVAIEALLLIIDKGDGCYDSEISEAALESILTTWESKK